MFFSLWEELWDTYCISTEGSAFAYPSPETKMINESCPGFFRPGSLPLARKGAFLLGDQSWGERAESGLSTSIWLSEPDWPLYLWLLCLLVLSLKGQNHWSQRLKELMPQDLLGYRTERWQSLRTFMGGLVFEQTVAPLPLHWYCSFIVEEIRRETTFSTG